jgi:hypothetical protein
MAQQAAQTFEQNFGTAQAPGAAPPMAASALPPAAAPSALPVPPAAGPSPANVPMGMETQQQAALAQAAPVGVAPHSGPAPRPDSINQIMQQQAQQAHPHALGEQLREQRMEQLLAEGQQRTQELQAQLQAQQAQLQQQTTQQADYQRQQVELQRQQLELQQQQAQQAQQQQVVPPEQRYAWSDQEQQTFGDARPVIEKTAMQIAEQMLAERGAQQDPRVAELEQQLTQLRSTVDQSQQQAQQNFESQVEQSARAHGLDVHTLSQNPQWLAMMNETQQTVPGSTVGSTFSQVVNSALNGSRTAAEVGTLDHVFEAFAQRQNGQQQQLLGQVPGGVAPARNTGTPPPANAQGVQVELQQLANREETLRDQLRRAGTRGGTRLDPQAFQKEMLAIEQRRTVLEQQIITR